MPCWPSHPLTGSTSKTSSTKTPQARPPHPQHLAQADPHRRHNHQLHLHRRADLDPGRFHHRRSHRRRIDRPVRHLPQRLAPEHRDVRQRLRHERRCDTRTAGAMDGSDIGAPTSRAPPRTQPVRSPSTVPVTTSGLTPLVSSAGPNWPAWRGSASVVAGSTGFRPPPTERKAAVG